MPLWLLLALFIVVPLAELYVILQVAELLGGGVTGRAADVALLALDSLIGTLLLRSQGRAVWRRFNVALSEGRMPHREVIDGVLVIVGGALLLTPGFLSDILGIVLLIPPTRAVIRRLLIRRLGSAPRRRRRDRRRLGPLPARLRRRGQRHRVRAPAPRTARAVSAPALAFAFFDPARDVYGTARAGATLLFEGRTPTAHGEGPTIEPHGDRLRAELPGRALARARAGLAGGATSARSACALPRARRSAAGRRSTASARSARRAQAPTWEQLDLLRSRLGRGRRAATRSLALARRPRGAVGHGDERVTRLADRGRRAAHGRGRAHLDRLRRRRAPAQRRPRAVAAAARTTRTAARARRSPARRWSWRA